MKSMKIVTIITVLIIVGLLTVVVIGSKNKNQSEKNVPIFFYGNTCPHCADVEDWMKKNNVESKVKIIKKEVYDNQQNSKELVKTAEKCGLPTDSIGVPFLFAENKCLIGTPDIINYLSEKAQLPK